MDGAGPIADDLAEASVLFVDVVDFTPVSAALSPAQLVELLDTVISCFDAFVAELGLEKIKTVGDAYMAAAGVPRPRPDHALAIADLAVRIRDHEAVNPVDGSRLRFRIGINSEPVTAGDRHPHVLLRPVGRHGEHGEPHGIVGRAGARSRSRPPPTS